jgi:hypothetical protein
MNKVVPPVCLVLSILLFVAGFAFLATDKPEPNIELHRARLGSNEQYKDQLEEQLEQRKFRRFVSIATLFGTAVSSAVVAFLAMRPSKVRTETKRS